ncbi:MAG: diaminopimelate epimerase [Terriglobales bacterium]
MNSAQNTPIRFTKASACGNDFLIVNGVDAAADLAALTRLLCDRHNGVGADGVEWIFADPHADAMARLINADGSEAEISGNGTRCVAAEMCSRSEKQEVVIRTGAGLKTCRLLSQHYPAFEFETELGVPVVGEELTIDVNSFRAIGRNVSMGNPHYVIMTEKFRENWQHEAALIQSQAQFPQGTNVEYVVVRGPNQIEIRLFERGVGETQSSGTGSCAAAVAAIASGHVTSPVTVVAPGGGQTVRWEGHVYLRGPATLICRGEFFI